MDIRSSVDGLRDLLGAPSSVSEQTQPITSQGSSPPASLGGDHATLSSAGAEVALAASESDVRVDKVAEVQSAISAGQYNVPASAVAGKVVDAMLSRGRSSAN